MARSTMESGLRCGTSDGGQAHTRSIVKLLSLVVDGSSEIPILLLSVPQCLHVFMADELLGCGPAFIRGKGSFKAIASLVLS